MVLGVVLAGCWYARGTRGGVVVGGCDRGSKLLDFWYGVVQLAGREASETIDGFVADRYAPPY